MGDEVVRGVFMSVESQSARSVESQNEEEEEKKKAL